MQGVTKLPGRSLPPATDWEVWIENEGYDSDDDSAIIGPWTAASIAVEEFIKEWDSDTCAIVNGETIGVSARRVGETTTLHFEVTGQLVPRYTVTFVKDYETR